MAHESTGPAVALIDCDGCPVRHVQCADCVVTALAGDPDHDVVPPIERYALSVLAAAGMIPAESDAVVVQLRRAG